MLSLFSRSVVSDSLWPHGLRHTTVPHHLPKFAQVRVHCIGDARQPSHPLMPSSPSALNLSQHQGLFQWTIVRIRWSKYWSSVFSFSINPSNEYSGLISLKTDLFGLLTVQGTLRGLSPAPQLEGINSSALCLHYCRALTTIRDHSEDHSLDWQSSVSDFQHTVCNLPFGGN